ncbi:ribonuclease H-like domain-containing protein, partial [Tanacetum coccineum]
IALLKRSVGCKEYELGLLRTELEKVKQENEGFEFKIAKFEKYAKDLDHLLGSQITDKSKKGFGYNVVPSPHPLILNRPTTLDLSYSGLEEFKEPEVNEYGPRDSNLKPTTGCDKESDNSKENTDDSLEQHQMTDTETSSVESSLKDWVSDDEDEVETTVVVKKKTVIPTAAKKEFVKLETQVKRIVKYAEMYRVLPPATQEEQFADEKERKARTLLLMAVPKDHLRHFHGMDDAKEIWAAIKTRFGGNANSKKMQKAVLKQQFEAFTISSKESLEKGYDRFQKLLSQLDALGAGVSDEDANHKFLRSLPPAWDSLAMTMRTKKNIDTLSIDDLYNNLSVLNKTSKKPLPASISKPQSDLDKIDDVLEEMGSKLADCMTAIKIKKFYKKTGRRPRVDGKMHVAFDKRKVECFNCHNTGHFARECKFKGSKEGSRQEAGRGQDFKPVRTEKEALMTIDEGQINWVEQTADEELNHALMAFTVNNEVSMCSKLCLDSYNALTVDAGYYDIPLYSRFKQVEYKGVPHPLSGDYTPREQEDIDDSLLLCHPKDYNHKCPNQTDSVPSCAQHVKTPRQPIRTPVTPSPIHSNNRQNWNQRMKRELGAGYSFERKPCFVCGSLSHLIKDCDYYEMKMAREAALKSPNRVVHVMFGKPTRLGTNTNRVNKANQFTPRPVQLSNIRPNLSTASKTIKTGRVNVNTGHGNVSTVSSAGTQIKSGSSRFNTGKQKLYCPKKCFSKQRSPVNRPFSRNTAHKSNKYAVKGKMGTAVKTSAGCVWRKVIPLSNTNSGPTPDSNVNVFEDHPLKHMEHRGIFDSGCSGHMTGNRAHLEDYQELSKVGSVTFGGSKGSISGKGTIRLGNLVFDVAFVKELGHFNLFSISQICDKKLNVLFTEKECFVVSSDFKMPDENQGIKYEFSHAESQQNGVAERMILDLYRGCRTELADSKLPTTFWAEAVNTACYTVNRMCRLRRCRPDGGFFYISSMEQLREIAASILPVLILLNTGSDNSLILDFEDVTPGNIKAISPSADNGRKEVFFDADVDEMPEIWIYD